VLGESDAVMTDAFFGTVISGGGLVATQASAATPCLATTPYVTLDATFQALQFRITDGLAGVPAFEDVICYVALINGYPSQAPFATAANMFTITSDGAGTFTTSFDDPIGGAPSVPIDTLVPITSATKIVFMVKLTGECEVWLDDVFHGSTTMNDFTGAAQLLYGCYGVNQGGSVEYTIDAGATLPNSATTIQSLDPVATNYPTDPEQAIYEIGAVAVEGVPTIIGTVYEGDLVVFNSSVLLGRVVADIPAVNEPLTFFYNNLDGSSYTDGIADFTPSNYSTLNTSSTSSWALSVIPLPDASGTLEDCTNIVVTVQLLLQATSGDWSWADAGWVVGQVSIGESYGAVAGIRNDDVSGVKVTMRSAQYGVNTGNPAVQGTVHLDQNTAVVASAPYRLKIQAVKVA
jgi:hypothetical protein